MFNCLNIWPYRHLIVHKSWADFRAESERSYLGMIWWLLDPIINVLIYFFIFAKMLGRGGPDYLPFLTIGIFGWIWFNASVVSSSKSLLQNVAFVRQVPFKKIIFPCSQILVSTYQFLFAFIVLFAVLFLYGFWPTAYWLLLPVLLLVELLLILALGFCFGAIVPFVPDLGQFITYTLRFFFFLSCVIMPFEALPERYQPIFRLNPMVHILNSYRDILMYHRAPNWAALGVLAGVSLIGIFIGARLLQRYDKVYAKRIIQ